MLTQKVKTWSSHGATQSPSSSISTLQSLFLRHFSKKSTPKSPIHTPHFIIDYLINSLAFSKPQALSVSINLTHLKSPKKPDSVLSFFTQIGLNKTQIKNIISSSPTLLTTNVHKTLIPKFKVFQELGLSGSDLEKLFKPSRTFSTNRLLSNVNYLRNLLGNDQKVVKVITRSWWLLSKNFSLTLSLNISVLKKYGVSNDKIQSFLIRNPCCLLQTCVWFEETIRKVEPVLGIRPESPRFFDGFEIVASMSKSTLDTKVGIFRSFGWSDSDVSTMISALPFCLRCSGSKLRMSLCFFMDELGYSSAYLATHPALFVYSLEKRVLPRYKVLEVLREKKLLKSKFSLCSVVAVSEAKFVKDFVLPYSDQLPDLYEVYTNATLRSQNVK